MRNRPVTGLNSGPPRPFVAEGPCPQRTPGPMTPESVGLGQGALAVNPSQNIWRMTHELALQGGFVAWLNVRNCIAGCSFEKQIKLRIEQNTGEPARQS